MDYATASFVSVTPRHQQEVFDFCVSLAEDLNPAYSFAEVGASPHFERVFSHPLGYRIELTQQEATRGRNPGTTCLSLPGAVFYLQSSEEQALMLWKVCNADGFKWFTRLDFQNTELDPVMGVDAIHQGVEAQELWVKGYGSWRPYGEIDAHGECPGGRTLYWGSARAERQGRTYDKAKQLGWATPAVRDEVQLRGRWAHAFGRELKRDLNANLAGPAMVSAVNSIAVSALTQHLQYMETLGADPKTDKNWLRKARPADWFTARIGREAEPVRKAPKPLLDLESTVAWGVQQYGRVFALYVARLTQQEGLSFEEALEELYWRFYGRLRPEDGPEYLSLPAGAHCPAWREELEWNKDLIAQQAEQGWLRS